MTKIENPHPAKPAVAPQTPARGHWVGWVVLALITVLGTAVVWRLTGRSAGYRRQMPPVSVATVAATKGDLHVFLSGLGSVTPLNTVTVRSRAVGELLKIHFTEGQLVQAGDLLAEIDPRAYQAALDQAEGQLARDQAQLDEARIDLARYQNAEAAVTQQQVDTAKASVAELTGAVRADQGAVDNDRLQLGYCQITAPISGRAGLKLVDQGNLIQASDTTGIVVLTQEQPISVVFSLPEDNLPQLRAALAAGRTLPVQVYDRAQRSVLASGTLAAIDNQIDLATGTVRLRALFPNDDHALYPNQFVNARLLIDLQQGATLVPNTAIQPGAQTNSVFVVKSDDKGNATVERRSVKLGLSEGERTAIVDGVAPGEIVAADGLDKLQDGSKVIPHAAGADGTPAAAAAAGSAAKDKAWKDRASKDGGTGWPRRDQGTKSNP